MGEGEKYNFYVHSDIKEKVVIINITPTRPRATTKASDQSVHVRSLLEAPASRLNILWASSRQQDTILSFNGYSPSECTLAKTPQRWKSRVVAHIWLLLVWSKIIWRFLRTYFWSELSL